MIETNKTLIKFETMSEATQTTNGVDHSFVNSSLQITIHRLNGNNYSKQSQSVKLVIDGRGKSGYLMSEVMKLVER